MSKPLTLPHDNPITKLLEIQPVTTDFDLFTLFILSDSSKILHRKISREFILYKIRFRRDYFGQKIWYVKQRLTIKEYHLLRLIINTVKGFLVDSVK